ncbi:phage tail assembly protein [Acidaminococcus sp.]|uniref:phage tail assembly protein n=1 Tax=Acidaminococcus sp. TaxID=1872103 RepID=UPI003D7DA249
MKKIKLTKPIQIGGKEVNQIELDFGKVTGRDLSQAESTVRASGEMTPMLTFSGKYQAAVAAKMLGIKYDDVLDMPGSDYVKITTTVLNFLTEQG